MKYHCGLFTATFTVLVFSLGGTLALAAMAPNGVVMVVALAGIAFAYGAVIAVYPLPVGASETIPP